MIAERHPQLRLVIDHLAKPPIGRDLTEWSVRLRPSGDLSERLAKVSGMYPAQGDRSPWTVEDLRPAFLTALGAFGADRLMIGSDWPICEVAGGYGRVLGALNELTEGLSSAERAALRGGTAEYCYGLGRT